MATKEDTPQRVQYPAGFISFKDDGNVDVDDSMENALGVLEYLAYVDAHCIAGVPLEGEAQDGRFRIEREAIDTIKQCQEVRGNHG